MDMLLSDPFRRAVVQTIIAVLFGLIALPTFLLLILLSLKLLGQLQGWPEFFAGDLITFLSYPIDKAPAQLSALIVSTLPALVTVVCFTVDRHGDKPKATDQLNLLGKFALVWLLLGAASTLILVVLFATIDDLFDGLARPETAASMKLVVTGIFSFQLIYVVKLLGIENAITKST